MMSYDVIILKMFSEQTTIINVLVFIQGSLFSKLLFPHINVIFLHSNHININNNFFINNFFSKYLLLSSLKYHFKLN